MKLSGTLNFVVSAVAIATMIGAIAPAYAQDPSDDSVLTRKRPEFDPLGIRAGTFLLFPQVRVVGQFDDNIFATDSNEEDDIVLGVQPSVTARSQWSRHAFNLTADADLGFFVDNDDSNYEDFGLSTTGRIDVVGESAIRYRGFIRKDHENRDSPEEVGDQDVTDLIDGGFGVNYRHVINRLFVQPGVDVRRRDFDDVGNINNDDRDYWRYAPSLRFGYAVSPGVAVFAGVEYNTVVYDETPNDAGVDRDSDGFAFIVGSEFDLTGKLLGEIQVGYQSQEYDDNTLDDFSGLRAEGELTFNMTQLTALVVNAGAGLVETNISQGGDNASGNFRTNIGGRLVHELRRNILIQGNANYIRDDFEGIDRTDNRFELGGGLSYSLNRNLAVDLNYTYSTRDSDNQNNEFDRSVVTVGLTARL